MEMASGFLMVCIGRLGHGVFLYLSLDVKCAFEYILCKLAQQYYDYPWPRSLLFTARGSLTIDVEARPNTEITEAPQTRTMSMACDIR